MKITSHASRFFFLRKARSDNIPRGGYQPLSWFAPISLHALIHLRRFQLFQYPPLGQLRQHHQVLVLSRMQKTLNMKPIKSGQQREPISQIKCHKQKFPSKSTSSGNIGNSSRGNSDSKSIISGS